MKSEPTFILLQRVRDGNEKLREAWLTAIDALDRNDEAEYEQQMLRIDRALPRLEMLCNNLVGSGYEECLFDTPRCEIESGYFCYVCPAKWFVTENEKQMQLMEV